MNKKYLVIGADGLVGHNIFKLLINQNVDVVGTYKKLFSHEENKYQLDLRTDIYKLKEDNSPLFGDVVILAAGITNVDACEEKKHLSRAANLDRLSYIVELVNKHSAQLVYFSSDYVFDGESGPYTELNYPNPVNEYGWQKMVAELYLLNNLKIKPLIIRTCGVYGSEIGRPKNFVCRLIEFARLWDGLTAFKAPIDQFGTPTYAPDLATKTLKLIEMGADGILHIAGPLLLSRYVFGREVCREFNLDDRCLWGIATESLGQVAKRPLKAGLISKVVEDLLGEECVVPIDGLRMMKESLDNL